MFANKQDFRDDCIKASQLRDGFFFFNSTGRSYFKYLVEVCLELFRKHICKSRHALEYLYIKRLARSNHQYILGPQFAS